MTFRYGPGRILVCSGFAIISLYVVVVVVRDPAVMSLKGLFILLVVLTSLVLMVVMVYKHWTTSWALTLTPMHLIATHEYRPKRFEIPWSDIKSVGKAWRCQRMRVSVIETIEHDTIPFAMHLTGYERFIEELKARALNWRARCLSSGG